MGWSGISLSELSRAPHAVVVPCHSFGSEVACFVSSYADWRYATVSGSTVGEYVAFSVSRAQKWRIRRDHKLYYYVRFHRNSR
jgi:hypothetical protein